MKKQNLIKMLYALYTSVDMGEEENWQAFMTAAAVIVPGFQFHYFFSNVNTKYYENFENFIELFEECYDDLNSMF